MRTAIEPNAQRQSLEEATKAEAPPTPPVATTARDKAEMAQGMGRGMGESTDALFGAKLPALFKRPQAGLYTWAG
jgi:hypothetical protein